MTTETVCQISELLPGKFAHMDEIVKNQLQGETDSSGAGIPGFVWGIVSAKAAESIHEVLGYDVMGLLALAWCSAHELQEYTDICKYPPRKKLTVFLGEHKVATEVHPIISVSLGAAKFRPLRFTVELAAEFRSAELTIRDGHIIAVGAGDCAVSAQLKYNDIKLHKSKSRNVKFSAPMPLGAPGLAIG